jgi:ribosomal protein S18 acetylase RimI-like enzyme
MTVFTSRPYAGDEDLQAMIDLVSRRPVQRIGDFPTILDLRQILGRAGEWQNVHLWWDADGRLAGFAIFIDYVSKLYFEIALGTVSVEVAVQINGWGEERARQIVGKADEPVVLRASCHDDHAERIALLEQLGFVRQEQYTLHFARSLGDPIPEPQVPAGFGVRHVAGEHEADALAALHRAAFGTQNMTVEGRLSWMRTPEYDPELDLVAVAPDGTLAAYVFCSISEEENALSGRNDGYTDPVATHPAYQRCGLARALLLTGFHLLKQRGVETAHTSTGSWNVAMRRTARSVGYRAESKTIFFEKQIR